MSEFLLLFRGGKSGMAAQSPEQAQAHMQAWVQWMGGLAAQGLLVSAEPLDSSGKTIAGTDKVVTDGPFLEGKEMVGGYMLLKADSMDAATTHAKGCPILEFADGNVEVRAINKLMM